MSMIVFIIEAMALDSSQLLDLVGDLVGTDTPHSHVRLSFVEHDSTSDLTGPTTKPPPHNRKAVSAATARSGPTARSASAAIKDSVARNATQKRLQSQAKGASQTSAVKKVSVPIRRVVSKDLYNNELQTSRTISANARQTSAIQKKSSVARVRQTAVMDQYDTTASAPPTNLLVRSKPIASAGKTDNQTGDQSLVSRAFSQAIGGQTKKVVPVRPATASTTSASARDKSSITATIKQTKNTVPRPATAPSTTNNANKQVPQQSTASLVSNPLSKAASAILANATARHTSTSSPSNPLSTVESISSTMAPSAQSSIVNLIQDMRRKEGEEVLRQVSELYGIPITIHGGDGTAPSTPRTQSQGQRPMSAQATPSTPTTQSQSPTQFQTPSLRAVLTTVGASNKRPSSAIESSTNATPRNATESTREFQTPHPPATESRVVRPKVSIASRPASGAQASGMTRVFRSHISDLNQTL